MILDTTGDRKLGPLPLAMLWLQSIQTQKMKMILSRNHQRWSVAQGVTIAVLNHNLDTRAAQLSSHVASRKLRQNKALNLIFAFD